MSPLSKLPAAANVAVIGASGGIGAEFTRQLSSAPHIAQVHAFSRTETDRADAGVLSHAIDITDDDSVQRAAIAATAHAPLDAVIVATGILHAGSIQPEKSLAQINPQAMLEVMRVNAIGPVLVAKHFLPRMRRDSRTVFAALSARVGSIADNRLGGWASYRASKAALNMLLKTASIEQARRFPECIVVGLHPGTVDTGLSKPFQRRVPDGKLFTTEYAVSRLCDVIDHLAPEDSGRCFAWDGKVIEY